MKKLICKFFDHNIVHTTEDHEDVNEQFKDDPYWCRVMIGFDIIYRCTRCDFTEIESHNFGAGRKASDYKLMKQFFKEENARMAEIFHRTGNFPKPKNFPELLRDE